jgi:hypothetical protein
MKHGRTQDELPPISDRRAGEGQVSLVTSSWMGDRGSKACRTRVRASLRKTEPLTPYVDAKFFSIE